MLPALFRRMRQAATAPVSGEAGYILVIAIWITGLLSLLILSFGETVRSRTRSVAIGSDIAAAEALADAGVSLAVLEILSATQDADRGRALSSRPVYRCAAGSDEIALSIKDVAGLVDINFADEALLKALMLGAGLSEERAVSLAAAIVDYRDPDDVARQGGAEAAEYASAGLAWRPSNIPFTSKRELGRVLGMDRPTLEVLLPHITVHSQLPGIDVAAASSALVGIIVRGAAADWSMAPSGAAGSALEAAFSPGGLPPRFSAVSTRRAWSVVSEARAGRARYARETVVELNPGNTKPYRLLAWAKITSGLLDDAPPVIPLEPCD